LLSSILGVSLKGFLDRGSTLASNQASTRIFGILYFVQIACLRNCRISNHQGERLTALWVGLSQLALAHGISDIDDF